MDWHQLWTIVSLPDNVPIVGMMFILPFFTWYGFRQAFANDRLIDQLQADADMAKTHHRKVEPFQKGWARERLALPAAHGIPCRGNRDRHLDGLVDHS